jgi:hypothetical protein
MQSCVAESGPGGPPDIVAVCPMPGIEMPFLNGADAWKKPFARVAARSNSISKLQDERAYSTVRTFGVICRMAVLLLWREDSRLPL